MACRLHIIYVREDHDCTVQAEVTWLIWTIWTSLSVVAVAVSERLLNVITHSLTTRFITDPLLHVCNKSLSCGICPAKLKIAKVVHIHKDGDIMRFINCRSVSILPVQLKVLERLVYNRLLIFINKYQILFLYQFGF